MKNYFQQIFEQERKKVIDEYSQRLVELTLKYQKKYGFELNYKHGHDHLTWNCEADAFKHIYGSALIAMEKGKIRSKVIGIAHEYEYLLHPKKETNPKNEKNMDLHNNKIGRNIAKNLKKEYGDKWNNLSRQKQEDIIADKVWKQMKAGQAILSPEGRRKLLHNSDKTSLLINKLKKELLDKYNLNVDTENLSLEDLQKIKEYKFFSPKNRVFYENELNPININKSSPDAKYISEFYRQYLSQDRQLPAKTDLDKRVQTGELVYVHSYTKMDGTKVSGYFRAYPGR